MVRPITFNTVWGVQMDNLDDLEDFDRPERLPNLDHWKSVMEFSVEQAALLLAMIDPFDCDNLHQAKVKKIERWKKAHGHALGIISAIRQGLISPVACRGWIEEEVLNSYGDPSMEKFLRATRPGDRETEICISNTVITRASLLAWIESEKVQVTRPPRPIKNTPVRTTAVALEPASHQPPPLSLPSYTHSSEGLDLVQDAIKHFWATYDHDDVSTAPPKEDILKFLTSRGASGRMSEAVDLILRPFNLRTVHLRNRKAPTREDQ